MGCVVEKTNRPPGRSTRAASAMTTSESRDEGHDAVCREDRVEGPRRRRGATVRRTGRTAPGSLRARGRVDREPLAAPCRPTGRWPRRWRRGRRATASTARSRPRSRAPPGPRVAEQARRPPRAGAPVPRRSRCRRGTRRARRSRRRPRRPTTSGWPWPSRPGERDGGWPRWVCSRHTPVSFDRVLTARIGLPRTSVCARSMFNLSTRHRGAGPSGSPPRGPQSNCPQSEFLLHDCQHGRKDRA